MRGGLLECRSDGLELCLNHKLVDPTLISPKKEYEYVRSSSNALLPKPFNNFQHLPPPRRGINPLPRQTHANFLMRIRPQYPIQQQTPHIQTYKYPTITTILLLRRILQMHKSDRAVQ